MEAFAKELDTDTKRLVLEYAYFFVSQDIDLVMLSSFKLALRLNGNEVAQEHTVNCSDWIYTWLRGQSYTKVGSKNAADVLAAAIYRITPEGELMNIPRACVKTWVECSESSQKILAFFSDLLLHELNLEVQSKA